jgi:hypothetical protein
MRPSFGISISTSAVSFAAPWRACLKNRTKLFRGFTLQQAIERTEDDSSAGLSHITQDQYLGTLKELLELAVKKDLLSRNYATGMRPLKRDELTADQKTAPFDPDQLIKFFRSDFYLGCANASDAPYRHADKDWRFWFPLVTLFAGMRPREIFQLHIADIKKTEKGVQYFDIAATNDDDENARELKKTTKTGTSRRQVPIHPELQKIGFLRFVADQSPLQRASCCFRT